MGKSAEGVSTDQREELRELRKKLRQMKQERDFLAKAMAWFVRETEDVPPESSSSQTRTLELFGRVELAYDDHSGLEARLGVFDFVEGWYNPHRLHSALDYRSPADYEKEYFREQPLSSERPPPVAA
ncbi:transposase InsO family protein [Salinibacter ruber]|uniref:hypothetical protein n=1 Tax=Salinibacter ruber TaxID=146919 RepID=UPI002169D400|nr:hypothetical protein [Salinibacter ruber]MCS4153356.1 transposase InsO family protein [Salinibacter ruber]